MKADEAAEFMERGRESDAFKQRAAIAIAVLAMLLAVTGLGGQNATKEALNANIQAANAFSFYQAKTVRQTSTALAADAFELAFLADPTLSEAAKAALRARLDRYRATVARYESEPETREGKRELLALARAEQERRDKALKQDPYFDYAEVLLQIAIVLVSVSIIAELLWLSLVGGAIGALGAVLMLNGYTLLVDLPFLS